MNNNKLSKQKYSQNLDFEEYKNKISNYLSTKIQPKSPVSLYEPMHYTMSAGGKRLRPILVLLAADMFGDNTETALPAAVAIELLHNFTLVHDDIMDRDATRRGRPTVHNKWDLNVALLSGDGLIASAYEVLLETKTDHFLDITKIFTQGLIEVCEGQAIDLEFEKRNDVLMNEYHEMIGKKTAALLRMCTQIGGLIGGARPDQIEHLRQFGWSLGLAFQIQDDLLDITADQIILGKDFGSDIKQHKKTFLLIYALQNGTASQVHRIKEIYNNTLISDDDVLEMKSMFEEIGALKHTKDVASRYISTAKNSLDYLGKEVDATQLRVFLDMVLNRKA